METWRKIGKKKKIILKALLNNFLHLKQKKHVENDAGTKNNLISVRRSDFEVFQALAKDSEDTGSHEQREYSQEIPQNKPWEKQSGPPVLPPHLLQVILNKDTPVSVSIFFLSLFKK